MNSLTLFVGSGIILAISTGCDSAQRPSETEIRELFLRSTPENTIKQIEYGTTTTSQGGMIEMAVDAPKGTKIYPVKISYTDPQGKLWTGKRWVFRDSFGKWRAEDFEHLGN